MVKVSSKYDPKFAEFLKSVGGKWDPDVKAWDVPEERLEEIRAKAKELNVSDLKTEGGEAEPTKGKPSVGEIRMRLSKDGRFVLVSVTLLAFAEDVKALMEGKRRSAKFRVLPPPNRNE